MPHSERGAVIGDGPPPASSPARLWSQLVRADAVTREDARRLFDLFAGHYEHVDRARFQADLEEKDYVILLRDSRGGRLQGFSTQKVLRFRVGGVPLRAIFSGDTIIDRPYWGEQELVRGWCRFAGAVRAEAPETRLFWFLISKGYRTYLYLPLFFDRYFPRHDAATPPFEQQVMDAVATLRYPRAYRREAGILEFAERLGNLTAELAAIPPGRLADPRVQFFLARNPRYREGTELVCLAELTASNMRSIAARGFREGERVGSAGALLSAGPEATRPAIPSLVGR
jgi:hypothetical protein